MTNESKETKISHSERAHALLSPSSAQRWLTCTPSAIMEDLYLQEHPEETSIYAKEGETAHEYCELLLNYRLNKISKPKYKKAVEELKNKEVPLDAEMQASAETYADYILDIYGSYKSTPFIAIEQKLNLDSYAKDAFGTSDCYMVCDQDLHVFDFKYGKGVAVSAENNAQLKLYALGVYGLVGDFYEIENVYMHIIQPRLKNTSREKISLLDLISYGTEVVRPNAALAYVGAGEFMPSEKACKFCKVKHKCEARQKEMFKTYVEIEDKRAKADLAIEELPNLFLKIDELSKWANEQKALLIDEMLNGKTVKGWKIVEGVARRKIIDELALTKTLTDNGFSEALLYDRKLKSITELTKLVGKKEFDSLAEPYIDKPRGAPTLVAENDKRQPYLSKQEIRQNIFESV